MIKQFDKDTWYDPKKDQFIFSKEISLSGKPICLTLEVSDVCNLHCPYCLSDSEQKRPKELTDLVLSKLKDMAPFKFIIGGGEPFMLPNISHVIKSMKAKECSIYVATNGTLIPDRLIDYIDCFDIHIDSTNKDVYSRSMGKDLFQIVQDNIKKVVDAGKYVRMNCVANRNNYDNIFEFPDFCREFGIKDLQIIRLLPIGRGKSSGLAIREDRMRKLCEDLSKQSDLNIHFMYADLEKTRKSWFNAYPVFNNKGSLLRLPEHNPSDITIFSARVKEVFNEYKCFLYNSPRSLVNK